MMKRNWHHQHVGDIIKHETGTYLVAQWLRLHSANEGGMGSIPSQGSKIPHTMQHSQRVKRKENIKLNEII